LDPAAKSVVFAACLSRSYAQADFAGLNGAATLAA
jgi:hypothetical protein